MTSYLLDTNHLSAAVRPGSPVRREIRRLKAQGERFGTLVPAHHRLRRQGRVLSQVDMMLAAYCSQGKLTLLTNDRDFEALPELRTEDWTESGGTRRFANSAFDLQDSPRG